MLKKMLEDVDGLTEGYEYGEVLDKLTGLVQTVNNMAKKIPDKDKNKQLLNTELLNFLENAEEKARDLY